MQYCETITILENFQNSGDDDSLERYCDSALRLVKDTHSKENTMLAALCLLYLVRINTVKKYYLEMRAYSDKLIELLEMIKNEFPDNVEFLAILGIVNGNIANKTPVCYFPVKMKHGFRGIMYYKKSCRMNKQNKYVLLCGIGHCFNAPRLMGGNLKLGFLLARQHNELYGDDEWLNYLLADAYLKVDQDEARRIIKNMLEKNPRSFFAKTLKEAMKIVV